MKVRETPFSRKTPVYLSILVNLYIADLSPKGEMILPEDLIMSLEVELEVNVTENISLMFLSEQAKTIYL